MRELSIKNFKCFEKQKIRFKNLTILAGGNGAGKSTVIQPFLLLAQTFKRKDFVNIPKMLYLNDYYCELGSSERLRNYDANDDYIEFSFTDKNDQCININTVVDKHDVNTFNIVNFQEIADITNQEKSNALNFVAYFEFISADRYGPKSFHHTDSNFSRINVGKLGEYTALILNQHGFKSLSTTDGDLLFNVNKWLCTIFGYVQITTSFIEEANIAMIKVKNNPKGEYESPMNMPYGVSYLLPIIVSCLVRQIAKEELFEDYKSDTEENELIIIENPEAHLHPSAQSKLGYFLAKMSKNVQIIVETHSEHIINGIRLATLEDDIDNNEIQINFFESKNDDEKPYIKEIMIDKFSDLSDWPEGFFDQQEQDISEIFKSRIRK